MSYARIEQEMKAAREKLRLEFSRRLQLAYAEEVKNKEKKE